MMACNSAWVKYLSKRPATGRPMARSTAAALSDGLRLTLEAVSPKLSKSNILEAFPGIIPAHCGFLLRFTHGLDFNQLDAESRLVVFHHGDLPASDQTAIDDE